jgi:hypothetical protein
VCLSPSRCFGFGGAKNGPHRMKSKACCCLAGSAFFCYKLQPVHGPLWLSEAVRGCPNRGAKAPKPQKGQAGRGRWQGRPSSCLPAAWPARAGNGASKPGKHRASVVCGKSAVLSEGACEWLVGTRQPRARGKEPPHLVAGTLVPRALWPWCRPPGRGPWIFVALCHLSYHGPRLSPPATDPISKLAKPLLPLQLSLVSSEGP